MIRKALIVFTSQFLLFGSYSFGQPIQGRIIDEETNDGIAFAKILLVSNGNTIIADPKGFFIASDTGTYSIEHPMYRIVKKKITQSDSVITLVNLENLTFSASQLSEGKEIINNYHRHLQETKITRFPEYEFLSYSNIKIYEQSKREPENWELLNALESIEKNRFKYPNKRYSRVVRSRFLDGDSSTIGYIPINTYSLSDQNEYVNFRELKYYHPLFEGADKRYNYYLVDTFSTVEGKVSVLYFGPKPKKNFIAFKGLMYFINDRSEIWGGYWMPHRTYRQDFTLTFYQAQSSRDARFVINMNLLFRLKNIPNFSRNSRVYYDIRNTLPSFDVKNNSNSKWMNMALFNYEKDTLEDDTWMMRQIVDKEKLEYIRKDTSENKFVLSNTLKWLYNVYDGKIGYRLRYFDLNNEFAINKFESVRIGIGLQSHEKLSDILTFGGFFAYGIKDAKFKYGGNVGIYFGKARNNLLSARFTRDLLEPGVVNYMDKKQDLVRDFFTSRMDQYYSTSVSLRTKLNAYFTSSLVFNNYSLKPLYEYYYNPLGGEETEAQTFNFTETSIFFNIGTPFLENPNLRNIIYRNKRIQNNLFLNLTKGWQVQRGGDFNYWKFNARLYSTIRFSKQDEFGIVIDGGSMTPDQPYQINFVGPGTEFKLTGIIINNAFQSMKLYGFFADRYVHSFMNYEFRNLFKNSSKFRPELALAMNIGWGKISGDKSIHEKIEVKDYARGYYEAGVLLNNLLRLRIYNYFYGGLGVGAFYGFGPDQDKDSIAFRISYELGVL